MGLADKRDLNAICRRRFEATGASRGASAGTGLHALTGLSTRVTGRYFRAGLTINAPRRLPGNDPRPGRARHRVLRHPTFTVQAWAPSTASCRCPDGRVVADLKPAGNPGRLSPGDDDAQIAVYAHGHRYDSGGPRPGIRPRPDHRAPDPPATTHQGEKPRCDVVPLDPERGWRAAVAAEIHHEIGDGNPPNSPEGNRMSDIYTALAAVMEDCNRLPGATRNEHNASLFRGIDAVVNAVGPVLRKHRVVVVPTVGTSPTTLSRPRPVNPPPPVGAGLHLLCHRQIPASTPGVAAEAWDAGDKGRT